ncbi:MAG: hypothetical protein M1541_15435 [Acidobacteria bacterium]|nr:hypothetical protein [Acidobacteriota bacterium]
MLRILICLVALVCAAVAQPPVYVVLWFDTEDYVEPAADDAALRLAQDLTRLQVRATFKVVAEKARTLEARGRADVIRALSLHDIGYHSENHSRQPVPAVYLNELGYYDGALEFQRREGPGAEDVRRIFGIVPSCYGQPGSSWGPQSNLALRRMGITVYLDEGSQIPFGDQPFWYGGLLYAFRMGQFQVRASLDPKIPVEDAYRRFDAAAAELERRGGGLISTYYHPTEFVTTEFWDGVNFPRGATRERANWRMPRRRTREDSERCYGLLRAYVEHAKKRPNVRFVTARELPQLYAGPEPAGKPDLAAIRKRLAAGIDCTDTLSPADMVQALLGIPPRFIEGPATRKQSTYRAAVIPAPAWQRARRDAAAFIRTRRALPDLVWIGPEYLSLADFAATLAGETKGEVTVRKGVLLFERYFATDARRVFNWAIHPEGFQPENLLELGRLQGWTLKPARLR